MQCRKDNMLRQLQSGIVLTLVLFFALQGHSQGVCIDKKGNPCTPAEINLLCKQEKVEPNLAVAKPTKLTGVLLDGTGAPVDFGQATSGRKTVMQIRDLKTNAVLFSAPLLEDGRFDLGKIPAGEFRLLAVWAKGGELTRLPLADDPKAMSCSGAPECQVKAVIHFHGTDDFYDSCSPK
jgi:hypothetical protein